jgi:sortase A
VEHVVPPAAPGERIASATAERIAAAPAERVEVRAAVIDKSLWDAGRIRAFARAVVRPSPPPMAVLRIPRLRLEAPVLEGTDEWTLDRAVGHIEGTALPEEVGNVGIAGHRDGFFRALKDIAEGDVLELALPGRVRRYRVDKVSIVHQDDVDVLASTAGARLTLVTCYPFYFVGPAPERFIVHARLE